MTVIRLLKFGLRTLSFPGTIRVGSLWSQRNTPGRELRSTRPFGMESDIDVRVIQVLLGLNQMEMLLGTGHGDIKQTALFLDLRRTPAQVYPEDA
jgi:hypothetical protein